MSINLPYGKSFLNLDLPDSVDVTIIEPRFIPALPDPHTALRAALQLPIASPALSSLAKPKQRVGIIINDITRATPSPAILRAVLAELPHTPPANITIFNALGSHRSNTPQELRAMLGGELADTYRIVQNNGFDPSTQVHTGRSSRGHEIWLNRELMECDLKILTGFIEPHFFAGFSGGGKAIMPGMAGISTILDFHSAAMVGNPQAVWGATQGNPIWEEARETALKAGGTFLLNVSMNKNKEITAVYAGSLAEAHDTGCAEVKKTAMVEVSAPFDIVITTNSGYPLDQNLYQTVKGMSAAAQVVRQGGAIIIASACSDGIPEHGLFKQILATHTHPQQVLDEINGPGPTRHDQWEAQVQAMVQLKADVYVRSDGLSNDQIRAALLLPCAKIEDTVGELLKKYGARARICVIPEGPQTIPCLSR